MGKGVKEFKEATKNEEEAENKRLKKLNIPESLTDIQERLIKKEISLVQIYQEYIKE